MDNITLGGLLGETTEFIIVVVTSELEEVWEDKGSKEVAKVAVDCSVVGKKVGSKTEDKRASARKSFGNV